MAELKQTIHRLQAAGVFVAMVYLQEAHADDLWPLGYGIQSHSCLEERLAACRRFLDNHCDLGTALRGRLAVDTMDDHFLHTFGAWPERYFLADLSGRITWASTIDEDYAHERRPASALQQVLDIVEKCNL